MGVKEHKHNSPISTTVGIISISSTRTLENDESGLWIKNYAEKMGHTVLSHSVVSDDAEAIADEINNTINHPKPSVILLTGGTGISKKDVTIEAVKPLFEKEMTSYSVAFAQLSYEDIGSAALLSRSCAGIYKNTAVFCMPGSLNAVKLALKKLIFPELGHIVKHLRDN